MYDAEGFKKLHELWWKDNVDDLRKKQQDVPEHLDKEYEDYERKKNMKKFKDAKEGKLDRRRNNLEESKTYALK